VVSDMATAEEVAGNYVISMSEIELYKHYLPK
jgi:hypothetical protein